MSNFALVAGAVALAALAPGPTVNGVTPPPDPWYSKPPNSQAWRHHTSDGQAPPARFLREPKKPAPEAGYRARLVRLVNQERKKGRCPAVRQHSALNQAAQGHSVYMALTKILSHTERGGPDPGERVKAADYRFRLAGENILSGARNPAAAVRAWMASPEHRRSILTCSFRHVGIGRETGGKGPWWTLLLAAPR
ncbi:CAP domain-containing protein [Streptomyces syringium]|uniref:CAP domain-containing protein n=1 Tax=Streptomyces syringium TaxID=76729 RepID=UPI00341895F4